MGEKRKCIQDFGGEARRKEITREDLGVSGRMIFK
jgi:hypothetical protein